ncbi:MAG: oxidoreductase, partial [Mesorhizobium sp.]
MLALAISSDGPDRLKLTQVDEPNCNGNEALVAVHA